MSDLDQRRRTVRVLELLDLSYRAHLAGDHEATGRLLDEAIDVDCSAVSGVQGGIMIGEIPSPESDPAGWAAYVQDAREALAAEEERDARTRAGDKGTAPGG